MDDILKEAIEWAELLKKNESPKGKNQLRIIALADAYRTAESAEARRSRRSVGENPFTWFWSKIDLQSVPGCWTWTGRVRNHYGLFDLPGRPSQKAHRVAYEFCHGSIPQHLVIDHLCKNKLCVNPTHLEVVTGKENTLRGNGPTAVNAAKQYCRHGHEFTPENTGYDKRGRYCRKCKDERGARRYKTARSLTPARECKWEWREDLDVWLTGCGHQWPWDTPLDSDIGFCPFKGCGAKIRVKGE